MKQLFAYIRVSTGKQNEGVSPEEQKAVIAQYAASRDIAIVEWFKETRTAAKAGRPEFDRMVKLLRKGKADGLITHKVDRGTRNYRDWAALTELLDSGFEVHFANENIDMRSRGGRLAADVQVLVAVDYIRNLREETLKGIHGRLKQGIFPGSAPIGYINPGKGKPKLIDPVRGPLVRQLFREYAAGTCTIRGLVEIGAAIGLRSTKGGLLGLARLQTMLRNPFYAGVIRSARFGLFPAAHEPIVSRSLFDRVQAILDGKMVRKLRKHDFVFRRLLRCATCGRSLIATVQKGHVYYRCSKIACPTTSVREDRVDAEFRQMLGGIEFTVQETEQIQQELLAHVATASEVAQARATALNQALAAANARLERLTDLLLDGKIDPEIHDSRRDALQKQRLAIELDLRGVTDSAQVIVEKTKEIVELAKSAISLYEMADSSQKRRLLEIVLSNCTVSGKTITISMREPFARLSRKAISVQGAPYWNTPRTFPIEEILAWGADYKGDLSDILEPTEASKDDPAHAA